MITDNAALQILHTQPHYEELFLSIYRPQVLFTAQVSSSGTSQGARTIPYNNSSGTYTNVFANSVMLVGQTPGAADWRIRVRSVDGSDFTVAENSDIPWQHGLYLTCLNYIDLNPIYPRIINVTGTDTVIFYKDYDIAYTNQNTVLGAFPCAGSHQAAFQNTSGTASIYYSATGSNHVKGDSLTYDWVFEGGTPSTYFGVTPGNVTYSTPGHYKTKLTVSGSVSVDVTYRFVSIYPRAASGDAIPPIQRWSMAQMQGGRSEGGYSVSFKVYDQIDNIYDGALVILFADQTSYGSTKTVVGSNLKFVGYIQKGTIVYDYANSSVEFTAISVSEMLKNIEAFSVSCKSDPTPATWYEIQDMTVTRALYHYLKWHTTVLDCTDFYYTGDARLVQFFDSNRESIYDALNSFLSNGVIGEVGCNRQGQIFAEISVGATHDARTALPTTMSIKKQDWMGEPSVEEIITKEFSVLELGGVVFDGAVTSTAILSLAPGLAPGTRGKINRIEGFISTSQAELNEVCGDVFAYQTSRWKVSLKMAGNYNNIDIFPKEQCLLNVSGTDTVRGIQFLDHPFHPTQMDWTYDPENGSWYPVVHFAEVTNGMKGETEAVATAETIPIPSVPPVDINIPPIIIPPFTFLIPDNEKTFSIKNPTPPWYARGPFFVTNKQIARIDAHVEGAGTSVNFNLESRSVTTVTGAYVMAVDATATESGVHIFALSNSVLLAGTWLVLDIVSMVGSPSQLVVTITFV
jgi:hypothetical protein